MSETQEKLAELTSAVNTLTEETIEVQDRAKTVVDTAESASDRAENSASSAKNLRDSTQQLRNETVSLRDQAKASADRAEQISELDTVTDALKLAAVPAPDFHLPLISDLRIQEGFGKHDQIDVSPAQDGSTMVDLPTRSAYFTRTTAKTYKNKKGELVTSNANEPTFEEKGILVEGPSTNLLLHSGSNTEGWSTPDGVTLTEDSTLAPDGLSKMGLVTNTSGDNTLGSNQTLAVNFSSGTALCISAFVKRGNQSNCHLSFQGVGADTIGLIFDFDKEEIQALGTAEDVKAVFAYFGDGVYRVWASGRLLNDHMNEMRVFYRWPHLYTNNPEPGNKSTYFWGEQVEKLSFASSYTPTKDTPVTRLADNLTVENINNVPRNIPMTVSFWAETLREGGEGNNGVFFLGGTGNSPRCTFSGSGIYTVLQREGTSQTNNGRPNIKRVKYTLVVRENSVKIFINNEIASDARVAPFKDFIGQQDHCHIGRNHTEYLYGHIRDFKIWHCALTDEQVASLGVS